MHNTLNTQHTAHTRKDRDKDKHLNTLHTRSVHRQKRHLNNVCADSQNADFNSTYNHYDIHPYPTSQHISPPSRSRS